MAARMIAPRWVSWLLIVFGAAEVPWVVYLMFNQNPVVQAYHTKLAFVGFSLACALVSMVVAVGFLLRRRWAIGLGTVVAALGMFTAITVALAPKQQVIWSSLFTSMPSAMAVIAAVVAIVGGRRLVSGKSGSGDRVLLVCAVVLLLVAAAYLAHAGGFLWSSTTTAEATRMRAEVVFLDAFESIGLLGAGIASLRGAVVPTVVFGGMGAALLSADAWLNVTLAAAGLPFDSAIFYLVVGEIPSIILCIFAMVSGTQSISRSGLTGTGASEPFAPSTLP